MKGGAKKGASENNMELDEAAVNETDGSNVKDKRKQDEITVTPVRGSVSDGGEREAEDAVATEKASERKSPAAKRSHGKQPSIRRFLSKGVVGATGNDVLVTNAKSPEGEQGALKDINASGGEMESSGGKPAGFSTGANFASPAEGHKAKKKGSKNKKKKKNDPAPTLKTP